MNIIEFTQKMPKVELHVHLEGSILPTTLVLLAQRNDISLPISSYENLHELYEFRDFTHFIETYRLITSCLRTPEDYFLISYEFGRECARQNIRYAEVTFSMLTNVESSGLEWQTILKAMNEGRVDAFTDFGVRWQWIFDIVRNSPESQENLTNIALQARNLGVIALGLGGSEAEYPAELFTPSFEKARQNGMHSVPHAGEIAGPKSIWNAIEQLHADRIGHGVRCIEDPHLYKELQLMQIPLEICPTSNIKLGIYHDYAHHPLRHMWDSGLYITINSDDPPMFNTSLNQEYRILVEQFDFTVEELERVSLNALYASFLSEDEKATMANQFYEEFSRLINM